jgi:hypothetical protein
MLNADDTDIAFQDLDKNLLAANLYAYCWNNPVNKADYDGESPANIVGAFIGGAVGAVAGVLIANALGLTGWKKWALIAACTAAGAVLGAVIGPYVAKLSSALVAKASAAAGTLSTAAKQLYDRYAAHIFSSDHVKNGIMRLGSSKQDIFNKVYNVASKSLSKAANGSNQIHTTINGVKTTIRFYVEGGKIKSIDAFVGWADRVIGKLIK